MKKSLINQKSYNKLVAAIQKEILSAEKDIKNRLIRMYWGIGKHISKDILKNQDRAGYDEELYVKLSKTFGKSNTTLYKAVKFYEKYQILGSTPKLPPHLKWTHYELLIRIEDKKLRTEVAEKAIRTKMATRDLRKEVKIAQAKEIKKPIAQSSKPTAKKKLPSTRGIVSTCQVIPPKLAYKGVAPLVLDLGFKVYRDLSALQAKKYAPKDIVSVRGMRLKKIAIKTTQLYTYKAYVEKVVDGDTIWVIIDVGFGITLRQKLRLRGIDCPEINTPQGKHARAFVKKALKGPPYIIIKTHKDQSDKYDRYLADIYYLPCERRGDSPIAHINPQTIADNGVFLNQELLDKRLAQPMSA